MRAWVIVVTVLLVIGSCWALDCPSCNRKVCKEPGPCRLGTTTDVCGCCSVCLKGVGEECGGPWNVFGECADHLSCIRLPGKGPLNKFNNAGKCLALP